MSDNLNPTGKALAYQAAYELCRTRGLDPTATVQTPSGQVSQAEALLPEIVAHAQCTAALQSVMDSA